MPLNPSPVERTLEHTLDCILLGFWDDGDVRMGVVAPYDPEKSGPYTGGEIDYDRAAQLVTQDEIRELIGRLETMAAWMQNKAEIDEPVDWVVSTMMIDGGDETHGPFTKAEADAWAETQWSITDVIVVFVSQLKQPPQPEEDQ